MSPQAAKSSIFYGFWTRRLTLKINILRSKNGVLELARPCCFPVSEGGFWEAFWPPQFSPQSGIGAIALKSGCAVAEENLALLSGG